MDLTEKPPVEEKVEVAAAPKPKRKRKKDLSPEEHARLVENLKKGRATALENRRKKMLEKKADKLAQEKERDKKIANYVLDLDGISPEVQDSKKEIDELKEQIKELKKDKKSAGTEQIEELKKQLRFANELMKEAVKLKKESEFKSVKDRPKTPAAKNEVIEIKERPKTPPPPKAEPKVFDASKYRRRGGTGGFF